MNSSDITNKKIGGCTLIQKLGQGGMGSVYKANQLSMDRIVALKILSPEFTKDKEKRERFLIEAKTSAKLHHPNIIGVHGAGFDNGICYYLMEYLEGGSVEDLVKKNGKLSEEKTLEIAYQVTLALQHAHQNKLVHRDIKPDNFMITESGSIKLCDLGLAKLIDSDANLTQEGVFLGTPYFTSPEQAKGKTNIDIRADLYSLGASLFYLSTGEHLFENDSSIGVISMHLNDEPQMPSALNPKLSRGFDQLVLDLVEKNPFDRFQTPDELLDEISKILKRYHKNNSLFRTTARTRAVSKRDIKAYPSKPNYLVPIIVGVVTLLVVIGIISIFKSGSGSNVVDDPTENTGPSFSELEFQKDRKKFITYLNDAAVTLKAKKDRFSQISSIYIKTLPGKIDDLKNEMSFILDGIGYKLALDFTNNSFQKSKKAILEKKYNDAYQFMIEAGWRNKNIGLDMLRRKNENKVFKSINSKRKEINSILFKKMLPIKSKVGLASVKRLRSNIMINKKDTLFLTQLSQAINFYLTGQPPKVAIKKSTKTVKKTKSNLSEDVKRLVSNLELNLKNKNFVNFLKERNKNISAIRNNKDFLMSNFPEMDLAYKSIFDIYSKFRRNINIFFMGDSILLNGQSQVVIGVSEFSITLLDSNNVKTEKLFDQLPVEILMNYTAKLKDLDQQLILHGGVYSLMAGDKNGSDKILKKLNKKDMNRYKNVISKFYK